MGELAFGSVLSSALLGIAVMAAPVRAQHYSVAMTLRSPSPTHDEYFGVSVGVAADVIAVGSSYESSSVYVFDAASGTLRYTLTPPPGRTQFFGEWLTGVGNYLAVGDRALGSEDNDSRRSGHLRRGQRDPAPYDHRARRLRPRAKPRPGGR